MLVPIAEFILLFILFRLLLLLSPLLLWVCVCADVCPGCVWYTAHAMAPVCGGQNVTLESPPTCIGIQGI